MPDMYAGQGICAVSAEPRGRSPEMLARRAGSTGGGTSVSSDRTSAEIH
jgi:hypothetical protein